MGNIEPQEMPLFPLGTVLFPGMTLPLHIFEERYRLMMRRCLEGERCFGVVLIRSGREVGEAAVPYDVGTLARITDVVSQPDGRMNIATIGEKRFRILELNHDLPYLVGTVEWLAPQEEQVEDLDRLTIRLNGHFDTYVGLYAKLAGAKPRPVKPLNDPEKLSYKIASIIKTDMRRKQMLLETLSVADRITEELKLLEAENLALRLFLEAKEKADSDDSSIEELPKNRFSSN